LTEVMLKLLPILLIIPLGYCLKRIKIFKTEDTAILNKIIINLLLPAILFGAFSKLTITTELLLLPFSAALIILSLFAISIIISKFYKFEKKLSGSFTILFSSMEGGLIAYPLFFILFQEQGLATIALWDIANAIIVFTLLYFWACKCGNDDINLKQSIKMMITCPIPIAIVLGLIFNFLNINIELMNNVLTPLGNAAPAIIMLTLGIAMEPKIKNLKLPIITILSKTFIGGLLGLLIITLFDFQGLYKLATIVGATLPAPPVMYVFASEQNLEKEYIANYLSIALPVGIVVASLILGFF
jgi:predicted permease